MIRPEFKVMFAVLFLSFIALMILLWCPSKARAETQVTLAWDYTAAEEAEIDGFTIYFADNPTPAAWVLAVPTIAASLREQDVILGNDTVCQYFIVRAFLGAVESEDSNVAEWCPPVIVPDPTTPRNFRIAQ